MCEHRGWLLAATALEQLLNALATREDQLMGDSPMPAPEVFVGVDVAKGKHYACAVSASGEALFARAVRNAEGVNTFTPENVTGGWHTRSYGSSRPLPPAESSDPSPDYPVRMCRRWPGRWRPSSPAGT